MHICQSDGDGEHDLRARPHSAWRVVIFELVHSVEVPGGVIPQSYTEEVQRTTKKTFMHLCGITFRRYALGFGI